LGRGWRGALVTCQECALGDLVRAEGLKALDEVLHSEIYLVPGRYVPRLPVVEIVPYAAAAAAADPYCFISSSGIRKT
jgi:hypothetical protein